MYYYHIIIISLSYHYHIINIINVFIREGRLKDQFLPKGNTPRKIKASFTPHRFVQKRREKPPFLWKCSHYGVFRKRYRKWISTKTEVFQKALNQCKRTKTEVFENATIFNNELHRTGTMWTHKNGYLWLRICYQEDQCERTKTDVFPPFLYRNGLMWTGSIYATKTDHSKNGAVWTGPKYNKYEIWNTSIIWKQLTLVVQSFHPVPSLLADFHQEILPY